MVTNHQGQTPAAFDKALMAILANRFQSIVREMSSTVLRTARSAAIAIVRDFSCAIVTSNDELLAAAEGLPIHIFSSHLQTAAMRKYHPNLREGDAFLDNDPYEGNSHAADHTIMIPVFAGGEHLFTACAKAHQADIGNVIPTTYVPQARDVFEEGALIFPSVQIQRDHRDIGDVIRMCRRRIRMPDQWYGDYLALIAATRTAERRLKDVVDKYGVDTIKQFTAAWFDYSERVMDQAIRRLPSGTVVGRGGHDPIGTMTEPVPLQVQVTVEPDAGKITVDLRDNIDCIPYGLNLTKSTSSNCAMSGVFNALGGDLSPNAGSFRRVEILLRENCVVGIPRHPASCSLATINIADRLTNLVQYTLSQLKGTQGIGEGGAGLGPGCAVLSGIHPISGEQYGGHIVCERNGGPATHMQDGWLTYAAPATNGLMYMDSVEKVEQRFPVRFEYTRVIPDSGGVGKFCGAPGATVAYGPTHNDVVCGYSQDMTITPARGVQGGGDGSLAAAYLTACDGSVARAPSSALLTLVPGQIIKSEGAGGGGYGDPLDRDPKRVLSDFRRGYITAAAARDVFGVVFEGELIGDTVAVNVPETEARRAKLRLARPKNTAAGGLTVGA